MTSKICPIVVLVTIAWLLLGGAAPAPAHAQLIVLTPSKANPTVCTDPGGRLLADPVSVESNALLAPPFDRYRNANYEVRLFRCASDNPKGCTNLGNWTPDPVACSGGTCKWLVRLATPREVTVHALAFVWDRTQKRYVTGANQAQRLDLTWKNRGPCARQQTTPTTLPSLTLTVAGVSCSVSTDGPLRESTAGPVTIVLPRSGSTRVNVSAEMHNWPSTWLRVSVSGLGIASADCTGRTCNRQVNLPADYPAAPTEVVASTVYGEAGPRGGQERPDWVLGHVVCKVSVVFRKQ